MPYSVESLLAGTSYVENTKPGWNGQGGTGLPQGQGMGGADGVGLDLSPLRSRNLILLPELGSCI